jgi:hypothetical protein
MKEINIHFDDIPVIDRHSIDTVKITQQPYVILKVDYNKLNIFRKFLYLLGYYHGEIKIYDCTKEKSVEVKSVEHTDNVITIHYMTDEN